MVGREAVAGRFNAYGRVEPKKPDQAYLNAALDAAWDENAAQRALDAQMEALIGDIHDLGLPDRGTESEEWRGGFAMELVERVSGWWNNPPTIRVPTPGSGSDPENFADDYEEAINALIEALAFAQIGPGSTYYEKVKQDVIAYGRGYGLIEPDPYLYDGYPLASPDASYDAETAKQYLGAVDEFAQGQLPPLRLRHLPARRVMPTFDNDGLAEVFWIEQERLQCVLDRAEARGATLSKALEWMHDDEAQRGNGLVTVIHYANRKWCAEMVGTDWSFPPQSDNLNWQNDAELLGEPYEHWINRIPVAYHPGMPTPLTPRHTHVVSVVYPLRNIIVMLDRLNSMKATAVRIWAWPTPVMKVSMQSAGLVDSDEDGRPRPIEIVPGIATMLWPDEELSFLTWQGPAPEAEQVTRALQQQFDRIGLPPVESGAGDLSGYAAAQLRAYSQGKYKAINTGIRKGWHDLGWILTDYLREMPSKVYVPTVSEVMGSGTIRAARKSAYLRIDPAQLRKRRFVMTVDLDVDRSMDRIAMLQAATAGKALGLPMHLILEDILGYPNASRIMRDQMVERLEATPEYQQVVFAAALAQGQILMQQTDEQGNTVSGDLMNRSEGQIQAMAAAGLISPQEAQAALAQQQANAGTGQTLGAMAGGGLPPQLGAGMMGPFGAPGGAPPALTAGPMGGGALPGGAPPAGALGTLGGAASPAAGATPAARVIPRFPGGRAPGQSRQPGGPRRGAGY